MHKEYPIPSTPATKVPKVDGFITDYLNAISQEQWCGINESSVCISESVWPNGVQWGELIDNNLLMLVCMCMMSFNVP